MTDAAGAPDDAVMRRARALGWAAAVPSAPGEPPRWDLQAITHAMADALGGARAVRVVCPPEGRSGTACVVEDDRQTRWVLRRGPSVRKELAVAARLRGHAPIAHPVWADTSGLALGEPAWAYRWVEGATALSHLVRIDPEDAPGLGRCLGGAIGTLAHVRFARAGDLDADLCPIGWPFDTGDDPGAAFFALCLQQGAAGRLGADLAGRLRAVWRAHGPALLARDEPVCLVHGDANPANILVAPGPDGWRVTALIDFAFAHAGSPLMDLANLLRSGAAPPGFAEALLDGWRTASGMALPSDWPRRTALMNILAMLDWLRTGRVADPALHDVARAVIARCVAELEQR